MRQKICIDVCFTHIVMHTTVTAELAETAEMSAVAYDKIVKEYCDTDASSRTTYVITRYDQQWNVGEGACFSF